MLLILLVLNILMAHVKVKTTILIVTLIFGNFETDAIQVIKLGHQEFQLEGLPTVELFDTDTSTSCVLSSSYFDHTSNKYGDAGVTQGKMSNFCQKFHFAKILQGVPTSLE